MNKKNLLVTSISLAQVPVVFTTLLLLIAFKTNAQVTPAKIFSNGMVLQRDVEIPVWGTGTAEEAITISLNEQTVSGTIDQNGKWRVGLEAMAAGGPFVMEIHAGSATKTYTDVYIGDVWLASGQSNMEYTLSASANGAAEISAANFQTIRQFKVPKASSNELSETLPSGSAWTPATSSYVGNFSAVAYHFAKSVHQEINVPIGIINTSYGGSRIEAWMSEEMLGFDEEVVLAGGSFRERQPTVLYNTMLHPLVGFPIKGFIWYQGESNADTMEDALEYGSLFKTMISGWRELWGMGDLPFLWVQLPNYGEVYANPQAWDTWPQLRQNQSRALELPATGEAVTIDLGEVDIHPTLKKPVGERLAKVGLKVAYNQDIVYSGPRYKSHTILDNGNIEIAFDHVGSGLTANGTPGGFASNTNGSLNWADAVIDGDKVIVTPSQNNPTTLRYAWEYNPATANIYNQEGLPAAPFQFYLHDQGFQIKAFNASATTIERGSFSVLSWETHGADRVTLNDKIVDATSGKRVVPTETTTYTLTIQSGEETIIKELVIEVVDPKPTISIRTDTGGIADPETPITIIAEANPPKGGSIVKVEFFVDGELISSLTEEPFEITWTTPVETGTYVLTGVVTDNQGYSITSSPVELVVTKMKLLIYEAEEADYTGTAYIRSCSSCSNEKYLDLQSGWVLTFDNVEAPETGTYPLTIRYLLNYEGPKGQILLVNDKNLGEIMFEAPDKNTWMTTMIDVELNKGRNTIVIDDSWGWMSFDYIAIAVEDTSTVSSKKMGDNILKMESYPNPFTNQTKLCYRLSEKQKISILLYNQRSELIRNLQDGIKDAGNHSLCIDASELTQGVYFARLITEKNIHTSKLLLVR